MYLCNKHTIHNILVPNIHMYIVYVQHILIFVFVSTKFLGCSNFFSLLNILESRSSKTHRRCWREDISVWRALSIIGWSEEDQDCIICWELLQAVAGCWEMLGAGRRNRLLFDARVANTQEIQKETYKFKSKKRLLWQGRESLLFMKVFGPRTMAVNILRPQPYH